jgi:hypothetical protein
MLVASNALGIPVLLVVVFLGSAFIWPNGVTRRLLHSLIGRRHAPRTAVITRAYEDEDALDVDARKMFAAGYELTSSLRSPRGVITATWSKRLSG